MSDYLIHYKNPYYNKEKAKAYNHWYYETYIKKKRQVQAAQNTYNGSQKQTVQDEQAKDQNAAKDAASSASKAEQDTLNAVSEFAKGKTPEEKQAVLKKIEEAAKSSKKSGGGSKKKSGSGSKKKSGSSKKSSGSSKKSSGSSSRKSSSGSKKSTSKKSSSSSKKKSSASSKTAKSKLNQARTKLKSLLKKFKKEGKDKVMDKEVNDMNLTEVKDMIEEILDEMDDEDDED